MKMVVEAQLLPADGVCEMITNEAGRRRVQEGHGADRRSRMEAGTRAAGVLPPTI